MYEAYDRFGRTLFQRWHDYSGGGATLDEWDYAYDYAGNRTLRELDHGNVSGAPTDQDQAYTYDRLQRLTNTEQGTWTGSAITSTSFEQDWALDQLGNWAEFKQDNNGSGWDLEQERTHNEANELEEFTTTTGTDWDDPVHDDAGNMTTIPTSAGGSLLATYDAWNRLTGIYQTAAMQYDGLGRRIWRNASSSGYGVYDYYYNEQWQLLEERESGDTDPLAQYVWHTYYIDALAVRYYDADTNGSEVAHYYCQDANYNVTAVTDDNGDVLERYQYSPYGRVTFLEPDFDAIWASAIGNTHLYTGRERDPETGLQLNRRRYYTAHLGRWSTREPFAKQFAAGSEYRDGMSVYGAYFVPNNVDPSGLRITCWGVSGFCGIVAAASGSFMFCSDDCGSPEMTVFCVGVGGGGGASIGGGGTVSTGCLPKTPGWHGIGGGFQGAIGPVGGGVEIGGPAIWDGPGASQDGIGVGGGGGVGPGLGVVLTGGSCYYSWPPPGAKPINTGYPGTWGCFPKATLVALATGAKKQVQDVSTGEMVLSFDLEGRRLQPAKVLDIFSREVATVIRVCTADETIVTTAEHPFYVLSKGWTEAAVLQEGDELLYMNGDNVKIVSIAKEDMQTTVYNISVAGEHNYFVGDRGILVHNKLP